MNVRGVGLANDWQQLFISVPDVRSWEAVTIGDNVVVSANSVVDYRRSERRTVLGVPARIISREADQPISQDLPVIDGIRQAGRPHRPTRDKLTSTERAERRLLDRHGGGLSFSGQSRLGREHPGDVRHACRIWVTTFIS